MFLTNFIFKGSLLLKIYVQGLLLFHYYDTTQAHIVLPLNKHWILPHQSVFWPEVMDISVYITSFELAAKGNCWHSYVTQQRPPVNIFGKRTTTVELASLCVPGKSSRKDNAWIHCLHGIGGFRWKVFVLLDILICLHCRMLKSDGLKQNILKFDVGHKHEE
jgi:hypothetical protein